MSTNPSFRKSEYPIIAQFMLKSFEADQEIFNNKYTRYNEAYLAKFKNTVTDVLQLETQRTAMQKLKEHTQGVLYPLTGDMIVLLKNLRGYFRHANIDMPPIQESINQFTSKDIEDGLGLVQTVYESVERNKTTLEEQGMNAATLDEFNTLKIAVNDAKIIQNDLKNQRISNTEDSKKKYDALWGFIKEVSKDGKEIFKGNKEKSNQYTLSYLRRRMRNDYNKVGSNVEG